MELYDREEILCISVASDSLFMARIGILTACIPPSTSPLPPESSIAINITEMGEEGEEGEGGKLIQPAHTCRGERILSS